MMLNSCCGAWLLRGSQLSRANSLAHAEPFSIDMLPASPIGFGMVAAANLVEVAALVGDTARATMLNALMGGQSLTATELDISFGHSGARAKRVSPESMTPARYFELDSGFARLRPAGSSAPE
jgi:hypothetical protein